MMTGYFLEIFTNKENFQRLYIMDDKDFILTKITIFILKMRQYRLTNVIYYAH